jgi:hypothetical protein
MNNYKTSLAEVVSRLADSSSKQEAYLERLGVGVDELALEFDDLFRLAGGKLQAGELAAHEYDALSALDKALQDMSGPARAELWTVDALRNRSEWAEVRILAGKAVVETGETKRESPP